MRKTILLAITLIVAITTFGQDRHFTQFYASPLTLNPALTGSFDGRHRVMLNYRNQWKSILPDPFVTMGVAYDLNFTPFKVQTYEDKIGIGLVFFSDKVGQAAFSTNQIALSGAYHKALDRGSSHYLSGGFQMGIIQRSVTYNQLTFNDQFDGSTGYTLESGEDLPRNNFSFGDLSAGLQWSFAPSDRMIVYVGGAVHHVTQPQISFYQEVPDVENDSRLSLKTATYLGLQVPIGRKTEFLPRVLLYQQGEHREINAGANVRLSLSDYDDTRLFVGGWARSVRDEQGLSELDAVVLLVGFQLTSLQFGVSYDINVSGLSASTSGKGAIEFSFAYIGNYENDSIICPTF